MRSLQPSIPNSLRLGTLPLCPPNDDNITLSLLHMVNDLLLTRGQNDLSLDLAMLSTLMWLSVSKSTWMVSGQIAAMPRPYLGVMILSCSRTTLECQKEFGFENNIHTEAIVVFYFLLMSRRTAKRRQRGKTMEDIIMLQKMQRVAFYNSSLTSGNKII